MNVRTIIGTNAYACITHDTGKMDVMLHAGRSPAQSLRESAQELRDRASEHLRRAEIMESAAKFMEEH